MKLERQDFFRLTLQRGSVTESQDFSKLQDAKKIATKYIKSGGEAYEIEWIRVVESYRQETRRK